MYVTKWVHGKSVVCSCCKRMLSFLNGLDSFLQDTGRWVSGLFLLSFLDWLVMREFIEREVSVLSSSGFLSSPHQRTAGGQPCCLMLRCHLLVSHKQGGPQERGALDADFEIVLWIKETKGLCSARTRVYCSSWQLGSLPPSASYPLLPSASQSANPASCLLCDSLGGIRQSLELIPSILVLQRQCQSGGCCRW